MIPMFILQVFLLLMSAVGALAMLCTSRKHKAEDGGMTPIKEQPETMAGIPAYELDYRSGKNGPVVNSYGVV